MVCNGGTAPTRQTTCAVVDYEPAQAKTIDVYELAQHRHCTEEDAKNGIDRNQQQKNQAKTIEVRPLETF